ncbi:MAG: site-2 protease family protein [Chloroflexi bacterium]|nr:site-2 protease family protein [Chloroflexota bacterium]
MKRSINLVSISGIQLRVHFSWFFIFALSTILLVYPDWTRGDYWVIGIITSLLFFASVVAHELAHSFVGRSNGVPIQSITLFMFGGVAQMTREVSRPGAEMKMALAGPGCSLVLGGLFAVVWLTVPIGPVAMIGQWLAIMNLGLAVFNMIPGFPLDGGRVFRAILWRITGNYGRSTRTATRVGQGVGYLFLGGGLVLAFWRPLHMDWFNGLWLAFIGWFLATTARASYQQSSWAASLQNITAEQLMAQDLPIVPGNTTVAQVVSEYALLTGHHCFIVTIGDTPAGLLGLASIKSLPQHRWPQTPARELMTPLHRLPVVPPTQDVLAIMAQMAQENVDCLPVVSHGQLLGVVTRETVAQFLHRGQ